jgi:hypothetical protein
MMKYQAGGRARSNARTEDDSSPRNMPPRPRMERQDPMPQGFGEGYTPAPNETPMNPAMRPTGPVRKMKMGGSVTRGDGCCVKGKTKGTVY